MNQEPALMASFLYFRLRFLSIQHGVFDKKNIHNFRHSLAALAEVERNEKNAKPIFFRRSAAFSGCGMTSIGERKKTDVTTIQSRINIHGIQERRALSTTRKRHCLPLKRCPSIPLRPNEKGKNPVKPHKTRHSRKPRSLIC